MTFSVAGVPVPASAERERWTERDDEDALFRQLRLTVRRGLEAAAPDGPKGAWDALTDVGAWEFVLPAERDGLDLGHAVISMVCEEVGNSLQPVPLLGTLLALHLLGDCGPAHDALLERIRSGQVAVTIPGRFPGPTGALTGGLSWRAGRVSGAAGPFSLGVEAGALLLFATGFDGPRVILIQLPHSGVTVRLLDDHGGGPTATLVLDEVAVDPAAVLLAGADAEAAIARVGQRGAVYQAGLLSGFTAAAMTAVVKRIRGRQQFGQALVKHQAPRLRVAGLLARLDAIRWAVSDAARDLDHGRLAPGESAGLVALVAETALDITRDAVHLHGAVGLAGDSVVAHCYRRVAWEALRCGRPTLLWEIASRTP